DVAKNSGIPGTISSGCFTYGTIFSGTVGAHEVNPANARDAETSDMNSLRSKEGRSDTPRANSSPRDFWNSWKFEYSSMVRQNLSVLIDDISSSSSICSECRC